MKKIGNELHCIMHCDPGHGWLGVKIDFVRLAGVEISAFSYQRGKTAYLEEDCDAPTWLKAIEHKGYKVFVDFRHTSKRSPIRSYQTFCFKPAEQFIRDHFVLVHVGDQTR